MATDLLTADSSPAGSARDAELCASGVSPDVSVVVGAGKGSVGDLAVSGRTDDSPSDGARALSAIMSDLVQLTKPRIVFMILVTTLATAMIGASGLVSLAELITLLLATAGVAGSAGAANQIWEQAIDQRMTRTASRPLPDGRIGRAPAITFAALLGIAGTALLYVNFDAVPALVGAVTWAVYVLVYTPMKTRTAWNTTVGAVAGALPVLIGYTAMGGSLLDPTAWLLFGVLAAWQYPHFMAIAWMYRRQYAEAGFRMTTTVDPSGRSAAWQAIVGSVALIGCSTALCFLPGGWVPASIAALAALVASYPMLEASVRFQGNSDDIRARKLLRSSLLVLPVVLAVVTIRVFW